MNIDAFEASLTRGEPPPALAPELHALWLDGRGDWDGAHRLVQAEESRRCARVHAYLHRKEGDHSNASYWYKRSDSQPFDGGLEAEWRYLVAEMRTETN